jgi:hypothetical protein
LKFGPFKWGDLLLIIVFIGIVAVSLSAFSKVEGSGVAIISSGGSPVQKIILSDHEPEKTLIVSGNGIEAEILVSEGKIGFLRSECPDQICVHTGMIRSPGQSAVCLPAQIEIRIEGVGDVDAVSG